MSKILSRRNFVKTALGLGVTAVGSSYFWLPKSWLGRTISNTTKELMKDKQVRYLRQLVVSDNGTGRCIMWQSEEPMTDPHVIIRDKGGQEISLTAEKSFFQDDGSENYQYKAVVDNMKDDKEYEYAVEDAQHQSKWYPLKSCSGQRTEFSMLIFPDSQSSDYGEWQQMAQAAAQRNPEVELFANMGDLVDNGEDSSQWRAWFNGVEGLSARSAFAPVLGNHECYNKNWKVRLPEAYLNYFHVPANDSRDFERYYYSFDYGQVHFVVLGTVDNEINGFKTGLMEEQGRWLEEDLKSSNAPWKVVLMHRDVLQYRIARMPERKEGYSDEGVFFMPIFEKYKVDVVFTAHLHTYRNRGHILGGEHRSEGPLYILTGVAGNVRYPSLWTDHALDKYVAQQPETDNYLTMKVTENQLTINCFLPDGTQIDEARVQKAKN